MSSQLTIVTGPTGVDIGRAVAEVGARLDDGFAVRVINSHRHGGDGAHTSPDPFHHGIVADPRVAQGPAQPTMVRLRYLPSAWQDPQTNLGVVFTGHAHSALNDDLHTMAALGLDPSHRLTVQPLGGQLRRDYTFPAPIEPGDVGVQARDAVLRAGGHVLIEAGDGMTHLEALAALRLSPWAPWIGQLHLWTVFDVVAMGEQSSPGTRHDAASVAAWVTDQLTVLGATIDDEGIGEEDRRVRSTVVVLGLGTLSIPEADVAGLIFQRTGGAVDTVVTSLDSDLIHL